MLKFLLIVILLGYVFFKGLGFIIRMIAGGSPMNQYSGQARRSQQAPRGGNVNVDYSPKGDKNDQKKFKGGEYVDFEEVD